MVVCLAAAEGCARRHTPVVPSERLVVRAELLDVGPRLFDCGRLGYESSVVSYRPVAVREGRYSSERLYIVHSCSEPLRPMYPNGAGSVEALAVGNFYDLVLATPRLPNRTISAGSSISDRFEDKETPRYRALRTDPASRNGAVVLEKPAGCYGLFACHEPGWR